MSEDPIGDDEYRALAELRHRLRSFLAFSERQARTGGLEPQQHQLLLAARALAPDLPDVGTLAQALALRHHSTVELVDRLEKRGLVERVRSPEDRRRVCIRITRRGARLLAKLSVAHRHELGRAGPALVRALEAVLRSRRPPPRRVSRARRRARS